MGNEAQNQETQRRQLGSHSLSERSLAIHSNLDLILSRLVPRCSCGGELVIVGENRSAEGWRTGFKLQCKKCNKRWTYTGGTYHADSTSG
jgi:hypothetical protein